MKICGRCKLEKDDSEFIKNRGKKNGLSPYCKDCKRIIDNNYFKNNEKRRNKVKANRDKHYRESSLIVKNYLLIHPCVDCGNTDIRVLDFDHVNGNKEYEISKMKTLSIKKLLKEIEKCEVRCANCHRIKHWEQNH